MSTADTSANASDTRKGLPGWVPVVVIAVVLAGGGWGVWKFWTGLQSSGAGMTVSVDEKPSEYRTNAMQDRIRQRQRQSEQSQRIQREQELTGPDFVRERNRTVEVKGGSTRLTASLLGNGKTRILVAPLDPAFLSEDDRKVLLMRNRVAIESAIARQIEATPEQVAALNAIPNGLSGTVSTVVVYPVDANERKDFEAAVNTWSTTTGPARDAAANDLTAKVRAFEAARAAAYKAELAERVGKVKAILKSEQVQKFQDLGR